MNDMYSVKINRNEGTVEITGNDKEWVAARLSEVLSSFNKTIKIEDEKSTPPQLAIGNTDTPTKGRRKAGGSTSRAQKNPELSAKLTKEVKQHLDEYVTQRKHSFDKSLPAQAAIIATFLQDELEWNSVDHNDTYTVYSLMGWPAPGNPRSQLNNAYVRNQYFEGMTDGKYTLSHKGENFARHEALKGNE